jgi:DNA repair protein RecO
MIVCTGIVLKTTPFEESSKISSLFTYELGLIHILTKKLSTKRLDIHQGTSPLVEGVYHLKQGKSELYKLEDVTLVAQHDGIKTDFKRLQVGIEMLSSLEKSQLKHKCAPLLFVLLSKFLKELEKTTDPERLLVCFYFKVLRHEGLFDECAFQEDLNMSIETIETLAYASKFESIYNLSLKPDDLSLMKNKALSLLFC